MIKASLTKLIKNKHLLLAVSGGIDSIVMAHFFASKQSEFRCQLTVAHIDHSLREQSPKDALFVQTFCADFGLHYVQETVDVRAYQLEHKQSIEMAAHYCRKEALLYLAKKTKADFIFTAHHQSDQIETIFMRLGFGSGRQGLNGLAYQSPPFLKPFLYTEKSKILAYQEQNELSFILDESNQDLNIPRNFWRNSIIPQIQQRFGAGYFRGLLATVENLNWRKEDWELLECELKKVNNSETLISLPIIQLQRYFSDFLKVFTERCISTFFDIQVNLNRDEFSRLYQLIYHSSSGAKIILHDQIQITKNRDSLSIEKIEESDKVIAIDSLNSDFKLADGILRLRQVQNPDQIQKPDMVFVDADKLRQPLELRRIRQGDYFFPQGFGHRQKVNRYLKSNGIENAKRKYAYVLTSADNIVWLVGHRLDERYEATNKTTKTIQMERYYDRGERNHSSQ
jgi:tRNA(Ile)-lysidine synthase